MILEQQKKLKAQHLFKSPSPTKQDSIKKNQNYTVVPQNSQNASVAAVSNDAEMKVENPKDESLSVTA